MSKTSLHQRKKKDPQSNASTASTSASASASPTIASNNETIQAIEQEISKALQSVQITKHRTIDLQSQWRAHLLRMSYLVVLLSMHQCSTPMTDCIQELKLIDNTIASTIGGMTFFGVLLSHGMVEIMNVFISIALFRFLCMRNPPGTFSSLAYSASSSMIVFCMGLFFHAHQRTKEVGAESAESADGCLASLASWTGDDTFLSYRQSVVEDGEDALEPGKRQFPVACIFHVIVTACYFFMKYGMDSCDANIASMEKLQKELMDSRTNKNKGKNKASTSTSKSKSTSSNSKRDKKSK